MMEKGLQLDFAAKPPAPNQPHQPPIPPEEETFLRVELEKMIQKGAVRPLKKEELTSAFYSRLFVVHKEGCDDRPCVDLRMLNESLHRRHFKMEGLQTVIELMQ
jgi:hypothetical protein